MHSQDDASELEVPVKRAAHHRSAFDFKMLTVDHDLESVLNGTSRNAEKRAMFGMTARGRDEAAATTEAALASGVATDEGYKSITDHDLGTAKRDDYRLRKRQDVVYIRKKLAGVMEEVKRLEDEDNHEFHTTGILDGHSIDDSRLFSGHTINGLFAQKRRKISFLEYAQAADFENLRGTRGGDYDKFAHSTNKETRTLEYCHRRAEDMMYWVQSDTDEYALTPEQRLAIGFESTSGIDSDITIGVRDLHKIGWDDSHVCWRTLPRHTKPNFSFWNAATGNGKTVMAIVAAMTQACRPALWEAVQKTWQDNLYRQHAMCGIGIVKQRSVDELILARVVVAFVPANLMTQWKKTAVSVKAGMEREFGSSFEIHLGATSWDLKSAHEFAVTHNTAVLWLLTGNVDNVRRATRTCPNISYLTKIYDESVKVGEPREKAESTALKTMILQATVARLNLSTQSAPHHPLRRALEDRNFSERDKGCSGMFALCALPSWMRRMLWMGMAQLMPSGIRQYTVEVTFCTMATRLQVSEVNLAGLDALLDAVMNRSGVRFFPGTDPAAQRRNLRDQCKEMLMKPPESEADRAGGILARIGHARDTQIELHRALGEDPEFEAERVAHSAFRRVFDNILGALDTTEPLECPVSLEEIKKEDICILPCCAAIIDRTSVPHCNDRCPMCRKPMDADTVLGVAATTEMIDDAATRHEDKVREEREAKEKQEREERERLSRIVDVRDGVQGNEGELDKRIRRCVDDTHPSVWDYIGIVLNALVDWKPSCRVLLAYCQIDLTRDRDIDPRVSSAEEKRKLNRERRVAAKDGVRAKLLERCPRLASVGFTKDETNRKAVEEYKTVDGCPRVLIIDTALGSNSLVGLDLMDTDMVILDRTSGCLGTGELTQAIGRAMRPQRLPPGTDWLAREGLPPFPAKRVLYVQRRRRRAADAPEPIAVEELSD